MLDLFAAISSVDPPSLVAWLVLLFSAVLYPLGLMLGDCSSCCDRCNVVVPFNRCVRIKCLTCSPQTGVSSPVNKRVGQLGFMPKGPGTRSVCAKNRLFVRFGASSAKQMSDGESRTLVGRIRKNWPETTPRQMASMTAASGGDPVPAEFSVTLQGVTLPITATPFNQTFPEFDIHIQQNSVNHWNGGGGNPGSYVTAITNMGVSVSAARSVQIKSASVISGTEYLDPDEVTEAALLGMASLSLNESGQITMTMNANANLFRYLPPFPQQVKLRYWLEYTRGNTKTYDTVVFRVLNFRTAQEIPEEGFGPWTLVEQTWQPTPTPDPQPSVSGTSATIYSHRDIELWFKDYIVEPAGLDNVFGFTGLEVSASGYELSAPSGFSIEVETSCDQSRLFFDPLSRAMHSNLTLRSNGPYVFDYDQVDAYLAGTQCLQANDGTNTHEYCVGSPHVFCGQPLNCSLLVLGGPLIPPSATVTFPTIPTKNGCQALSQQSFTVPRDGACGYKLHRQGCDYDLDRYGNALWFYCGDLLWALENGRCRESALDGSGNTWTLNTSGGNVNSPSNAYVCPPATTGFGLATTVAEGKCGRTQATVEVTASAIVTDGPYAAIAAEFAEAMAGSYTLQGIETCVAAAHSVVVQRGDKTVTVSWAQQRGPSPNSVLRWCDPYVGEPTVTCQRPNNSDGTGGSSSVVLPGGTIYQTNSFGEGGFGPQVISGSASGTLGNTRATPTQPFGSVVSPSSATVGHGGGQVVFTWCCPERQSTVTVGPNYGPYTIRHGVGPNSGTPSVSFSEAQQSSQWHGATIVQDAYPCAVRGFAIDWGRPYTEDPNGTIPLSKERTVGDGTVSFAGEVECDWNAYSDNDWIIVTRHESGGPAFCVEVLENKTGLLRNGIVSITNAAVTYEYQGSPSTYNYVVRQSG
jgi:hypothetical protein